MILHQEKIQWVDVLTKFWNDFNSNINEVKELRTREILDMMNDSLGDIIFDKKDNGEQNRVCTCGDGELSLKIGRSEPLLVAQNIRIVNLLDRYQELKQQNNNSYQSQKK